ncbi:MAG: APC family permease, partial [Candidatus Binatia bacterium]
AWIVSATVVSLALLVVAGAPRLASRAFELRAPAQGVGALLEATALVFVAYTGYARIATLGEEVRDAEKTIPRAIFLTLAITMALYLSVAVLAIGVLGPERFAAEAARSSAPLETVARELAVPGLPAVVTIGAMTAMLGVLLNLVLGNSRMVLAMARRGDLPAGLAAVDARSGSPRAAVLVAGAAVLVAASIGDVRTTWTFSAFAVLVYYAITNLAALRLPPENRRFPAALAGLGLMACLSLAVWIELRIWLAGLAVLAAGFALRAGLDRLR